MIKVYIVTAEYGDIKTYILKEDADRHTAHVQQFCLPDKGEWVTTIAKEVSKLTDQHIFVDGDVIGYQFSRTTNGTRTVRRTVRDLELWFAGSSHVGQIFGIATIKGRICRVLHNPGAWLKAHRIDSQATWEITEVIA